MNLRISGKNLDIGEALRGQIEERLQGALGKYFDGSYAGHVTVAKEGARFQSEGVLHLATGVTLEASGEAHDAYASFDQMALRIEKRLRRHKRRLKDRSNGHGNGKVQGIAVPSYVLQAPDHDEEEHDDTAHPVVIAESTQALHEWSVSEAVAELDLTGAPVVMFRHAGNGRINIVYRRRDGHIGWIDPDNGTRN